MREIKFRGKRIDNGEWVYGYYFVDFSGKHYIINTLQDIETANIHNVYVEVIPETVGQYTGLHDKNGKEIYEGDIVKYENKWKYMICSGEYNSNPSNCAEAIMVGVYLKEISTKEIEKMYSINGVATRFPKHCAESEKGIENLKLEVIGNIYENKELLED